MKKLLKRLLAVIIMVVIAVILARNYIVPPIVSSGVKAATGLRVAIGSMDIGLLKTYLDVQRLQLMNPPGFADPVMVDIPHIKVDYDLPALLRNKLHLSSVTFAMQEVLIIKNADGSLNIDALKALQQKKQPPAEPQPESKKMELQIDELAIRIGTVTVKDYTGSGTPRVQQINLNLDERFTNVTDPDHLTMEIVLRVMTRAGLGGLLDLNLAGLQQAADAASSIVTGVATNIGGDAGKALQDAAEQLKKVLPFRR